jgi:UDP-GlcNAc:undecaprenyl-phosphate/decaprenyl-phosphate GlcNAc-1-phosphate transferase
MTSVVAAELIGLGFEILAGFAVPWAAMKALVPTLERSERMAVENYRGRSVVPGLGLAWVVWALGVLVVGTALESLSLQLWAMWPQQPYSIWIDPGVMPLTLVLGAFTLGFADDVFGDGADKGFRGHLRALASGRLSTGGLKLIGIGLLALATAATLGGAEAGSGSWYVTLGLTVLGALAIALTANLVNLTDLRPGRALKVYSLLVTGLLGWWAFVYLTGGGSWADVAAAFAVMLGPVFAVWRFDLGERAMLGDAGANAAGALAGWLACVVLGTWVPLGIYVAVLLALNLASEKFSFSRVIEGNAVLNWLDGLGRLPAETPQDGISDKTGTPEGPTEK